MKKYTKKIAMMAMVMVMLFSFTSVAYAAEKLRTEPAQESSTVEVETKKEQSVEEKPVDKPKQKDKKESKKKSKQKDKKEPKQKDKKESKQKDKKEPKQKDKKESKQKDKKESKQKDKKEPEQKDKKESEQKDKKESKQKDKKESKKKSKQKDKKEPEQKDKKESKQKDEKEPKQKDKKESKKSKDKKESKKSKEKKTQSKYIKGIDISHMNAEKFPNAKALRKFLKEHDEVRFVQIRCGGRGFGQRGTLYRDKMWQEYVKACSKEKVPFGLYFYSTAINEDEAKEEVDYMKKCLKKVKKNQFFKGEITLDIEQRRGSRTEAILTSGKMADLAQLQIDALKEKYYVTIYSDEDTYKVSGLDGCENCNFWLAKRTENEHQYFKLKEPDHGDIVAHQVDWDYHGVDLNVATEEYAV